MSKQPRPSRGRRPLGSNLLRIVAAVLAIALLASWTLLPQLFPPGRGRIGKPAADFSLPILANGEPDARLSLSDLTGKVVVLDFWATWCEPCLLQAPILDRLARDHPEQLVVVGVSVDEDPRRARQFARAKRLSYPIVLDETGEVQAAYGARTLPYVVVVDPQGKVVDVVQGVAGRARLDAALRAARER